MNDAARTGSGGPSKLMLVAVEPSGDALGAALIGALKQVAPTIRFCGCGGPAMEAEGFRSAFPIEPLSVMGPVDALRVVRLAAERAKELALLAAREGVDAAILIDAWGFSRLVATRMKKNAPAVKLIKFAAPQIWASRPRRVDFVRRHFEGVLCLLPFEPALFEKAGVKAHFVGNPNFQAAWRERGDGAAFRKRHDLEGATLVVVLPGSRKGEIARHMDPFGGALRLLAERYPTLRVAIAVPDHLQTRVGKAASAWPGEPVFVHPQEKADAFAAADAALAKSGTVTTELAINATPMVVAYRVHPLAAFWARRVVISPYATILNVAAKAQIVPELLQEECRPELLAAALARLLADKEARIEQLEAFPRILAYLGVDGPDAAMRAAREIVDWSGPPRPRLAAVSTGD